jgi:uncharacterized membrane protein YqaE (UPF0057 family)
MQAIFLPPSYLKQVILLSGNYWNFVINRCGTVSGTIPSSVRTGYRIRVVSSNPAVTGSTNLSNLIVNATSAAQ